MTLMKDGASPQVLRLQLEKANNRVEVAGAQLAALGAKRIKADHADLNLLERIAFALAQAQEACQAIQSVPFDPAGHHTPHPNDRAMPGAATKRVRYQRAKLERALEAALDSWEQVKENDFFAPSKNKAPSVRCRTRNCPRENHRKPAWEFDGTPNEFCSKCGNKYPPPEEAA